MTKRRRPKVSDGWDSSRWKSETTPTNFVLHHIEPQVLVGPSNISRAFAEIGAVRSSQMGAGVGQSGMDPEPSGLLGKRRIDRVGRNGRAAPSAEK